MKNQTIPEGDMPGKFFMLCGTQRVSKFEKIVPGKHGNIIENQWRNECSETLDEFGSLEQAESSYFVAEVSSSDTQETLMTDLKIINL